MRFLNRMTFSNKVIRWLDQAVGEMRDQEVLQTGGLPPPSPEISSRFRQFSSIKKPQPAHALGERPGQ